MFSCCFYQTLFFYFFYFQCSWNCTDLEGVSSLDDPVMSNEQSSTSSKEKEDVLSLDDSSVSMVSCETPNKNTVVIFKMI